MMITKERMDIAERIDHTLLKAETTRSEVKTLCEEAIAHNFIAVCIPPYFVEFAKGLLEEKGTKISTVVGFPLGFGSTATKVEEIKRAIEMGADELDVVVHLSAVKNKDWSFVKNDIESMTRACHMKGKVIKVILETAVLDEEEMLKLCEVCNEAGVDYVKTSTGRVGGATPEIIRFLRTHVSEKIKIKASGGIRNLEQAQSLIAAGADRLGTSAGPNLLH